MAANLVASQGIVPVRDFKNVDGPVIDVPVGAFSALVASARTGGFGAV
ncbi:MULTISPECIES: DUF397 domain-containing protein [unclassified Streptomyces]